MEKYGVACHCAEGEKPAGENLVKTASGEVTCSECGHVWSKPPPSD